MIECPICHVTNEDMSRFCAECGQRLSAPPAAVSSTASQASAPTAPPNQPANIPEEPVLDTTQSGFSRLRGGASIDKSQADSSPQTPPVPPPKTLHLRSPLLGQSEEPFETDSSPPKKRGLRSPLLGEPTDEPDQDEDLPPLKGPKGTGLRSPLLGDSDDYSQPRPGKGKTNRQAPFLDRADEYNHEEESPSIRGSSRINKSLRSPLLGDSGDNNNIDDYNQPRSGKNKENRIGRPDQSVPGSSKREHLYSSLLGEPNRYVDDDEEPRIDEDDPNVLRSPLLAAKAPLSDRPPTAKVNPNNPNQVQSQEQNFAPISPPPSPDAVKPEPSSTNNIDQASSDQIAVPFVGPGVVGPGVVTANEPPKPLTTRAISAPPGPIPDFKSQNLSLSSIESSEQNRTPDRTTIERRTSSLLRRKEDREPATHSEVAPARSVQSNALSRMLILPLFVAVAAKVWAVLDLQSKGQIPLPFLLSEIGTIVTILCLIVLCGTLKNPR